MSRWFWVWSVLGAYFVIAGMGGSAISVLMAFVCGVKVGAEVRR